MIYERKKGTAAAIVSIVVLFILSAIYLFTPMVGGYNWLGWILAILNLIAGPAVLIAYILEVRRGVFKEEEEAERVE
ncbi:MAG: hypothetical protein UIL73_02865 [Anaerovoracaceae bacterium]|nr:hypothetical protein [Anaerovoracaceae bacterium]